MRRISGLNERTIVFLNPPFFFPFVFPKPILSRDNRDNRALSSKALRSAPGLFR